MKNFQINTGSLKRQKNVRGKQEIEELIEKDHWHQAEMEKRLNKNVWIKKKRKKID